MVINYFLCFVSQPSYTRGSRRALAGRGVFNDRQRHPRRVRAPPPRAFRKQMLEFPAHAPSRVNCAQPPAGAGRQADGRPRRRRTGRRAAASVRGIDFEGGGERNQAAFGGHACKKSPLSRAYSRGRASGVSGERRKYDNLFPEHQDDLHAQQPGGVSTMAAQVAGDYQDGAAEEASPSMRKKSNRRVRRASAAGVE